MNKELYTLLEETVNENLILVTVSSPRKKNGLIKVRLRPITMKGALHFQAEEHTATQVFHKNYQAAEAVAYLNGLIQDAFSQAAIQTVQGDSHILVSKKGHITIKTKANQTPKKIVSLAHNRQKRYLLPEGTPIPFLVDLGVMTIDGKIRHSHYDKFRQINRFLEFVEDILPFLPKDREIKIIDFGCGKSYLTFAMYHYLCHIMGYPIQITGLDLKEEVIRNCNELAKKYQYDTLHFLHGDIADYEGADQVDVVVSLHACDTATDYALAKAIRWNAKVILSVPCCQHELNGQIDNDLLAPILKYGILKDRFAALLTDGIRAELLNANGYQTQILEFIDMEHTPKNLLIRAVKQGNKPSDPQALHSVMEAFHLHPTLAQLLGRKR